VPWTPSSIRISRTSRSSSATTPRPTRRRHREALRGARPARPLRAQCREHRPDRELQPRRPSVARRLSPLDGGRRLAGAVLCAPVRAALDARPTRSASRRSGASWTTRACGVPRRPRTARRRADSLEAASPDAASAPERRVAAVRSHLQPAAAFSPRSHPAAADRPLDGSPPRGRALLLGSFCHLDDCLATRRSFFETAEVRLPRYHKNLKKRGHRAALYRGSPGSCAAPRSPGGEGRVSGDDPRLLGADLLRRRTRWLARLLGRDAGVEGATVSVSARPCDPDRALVRVAPGVRAARPPAALVNILGNVSGAGRVRSLQFRVNGVLPVPRRSAGQLSAGRCGRLQSRDRPGDLTPGDNTIVIRARTPTAVRPRRR